MLDDVFGMQKGHQRGRGTWIAAAGKLYGFSKVTDRPFHNFGLKEPMQSHQDIVVFAFFLTISF